MKVSIIIPIYLANESLVQMTSDLILKSLLVNFNREDVEVLLIDDYSPLAEACSRLIENFKEIKNLKVIKNTINKGFGESVNIGVNSSEGKYVLVCNNDIYLPKKSIDRLIEYFDKYKLGMIGPVLSNAHGYKVQEISYSFDKSFEQFSIENFEKEKGNVFDVNFLMGSCMLTTNEIWNKAGGINKLFGKGYVEEVDLQVRIRKLGYKLGIAKDTFVYHSSKSPSFSINKTYRKFLLSKNSLLFLLRNGLRENWLLNYDWHKRTTWSLIK